MKKLIPLLFLLNSCCPQPPVTENDYTDVVIRNSSYKDSVMVMVTLQAPNSVVGMFGIEAIDTVGSCSKGFFFAHKDSSYHAFRSGSTLGAVISFNADNWPCQVSIPKGYRWGVNVFEYSINTPFEVFDLSCEDGINCIVKVSVDDSLWTTGDGEHQSLFLSAETKFPIEKNINLPGIFPYRCTDCKDTGTAVPQNCLNLKDTCSTFRTCQVARTNHPGGTITVEYLGEIEVLAQ